jgi:hypothetical protein
LDCAGGPDVNRRTIVDSWNGFEEVCALNRHMRAWSAQDETRLKLLVEALNMLPSCEAMAENVKAHCENMAKEIVVRLQRCGLQLGEGECEVVRQQAMLVLLDWFLGDFVPGGAKLPADDSNTCSKGAE